MKAVRDPRLEQVAEKVENGDRLTREDGVALYETDDLLGLGRIADEARRERVGEEVYFSVNKKLYHTNVCALDCDFCAFYENPGDEDAEERTPEAMAEEVAEYADVISSVHIVGGQHPAWQIGYFEDLFSAIKREAPDVHIKALTASEIAWIAKLSELTVEEVLRRLNDAGLDSMPGGGAEIFAEEVREEICPKKDSADRWLDVHRTAHSLGLNTNATMLYGHVEEAEHRVDHLLRLRDLQDETGGFRCFIPLSYQMDNNELGDRVEHGATGRLDLKTIAVARLLLDNFRGVRAYRMVIGEKLCQVGLDYGANDVGGSLMEERIQKKAGSGTRQDVGRSEMVHMVRDAGRVPVERDEMYGVVERFDRNENETATADD
ncbi:aminofutalosine synthase MqnE [Haladaptatus sp. F3-133]|jgi:aminodeoxyfutalosine synthase|uniref:Aminofutalosine synthase MqnE n=1 Tax=Halorutilus salinus TaxID=2487751 RepID=A0A9Q4C4P1_9EURY|nr:aminofutalosine synthase MqnE [Halorutilus salinus]MCX2819002.1 aminofutalosine synthase MqnE [Halorutilus salinus]